LGTTDKPLEYAELEMIEPDEATALIMSDSARTPVEEVSIVEAQGRYLPTTLSARLTMPRFDKAAVDGIGIGAAETAEELRLIATIAAGTPDDPEISSGECVKIMTGAPVPPGVARIVRFEYTRSVEREGTTWFRILQDESITNIAYKGENILPGDTLLTPRRLTGADIGIAASQGYATVPVSRPVRVVIVTTGSELEEPGSILGAAAIYDGNSYQLAAMASALGAEVIRTGIVEDDRAVLRRRLEDAIDSGDVVIVSGGVSMGELDFVPDTLESLGVAPVFHGLAMKPGRPTFFGRRGETAVFGLPGNPVSTIVQFEVFIAPLITQRMGVAYTPRERHVTLSEPFRRRNPDRHEYRPAVVDADNRATLVPYKGSGHVAALAAANAFVRIDRGIDSIPEGGTVHARLIR
jgi:molybdopterin molybdotransferase